MAMSFVEVSHHISQNEGYVFLSIAVALVLALLLYIFLYKGEKSGTTHKTLGSIYNDSDSEQEIKGPKDGDSKPTQNPVYGRRCPSSLKRGDTVWVIPGKFFYMCGTQVN